MASGSPKLNRKELERLYEQIKEGLDKSKIASKLKTYLANKYSHQKVYMELLDLYYKTKEEAYSEEMYDAADEIDGFNISPLSDIKDDEQKLVYIRMECCKLLVPIWEAFITWLSRSRRTDGS